MSSPILKFSLTLPKHRTWLLVEGKLVLQETSGQAGTKFLATSGCPSNQFDESWLLPGKGCLPPTSAIAPNKWLVLTTPFNLKHIKGVDGNFYPIEPYAVRVKGIQRSDLGIHLDANVPGSAGCIVIRPTTHWQIFEDKMLILAKQGIEKLPLEVTYNIALR